MEAVKMNATKKIELADGIRKCISAHIGDIWPDFTPFPFILYDGDNQVAVGGNWPERYSPVRDDIWLAEGTDPALMGCTSLTYHDQRVAVWDTSTWPESPNLSQAAGGVAHEMFHCFQLAAMSLPWANELLLPAYPHTPRSVALLMAERRLIAGMADEGDFNGIRENIGKIAWLREQRENEVGAEYMAYDKNAEGFEGTAEYVQIRLEAAVDGIPPQEAAASRIFQLQRFDGGLLANYRGLLYKTGANLCLAADRLCPGWQAEWAASNRPVFDWITGKLGVEKMETALGEGDLQTAGAVVSEFISGKERRIAEFMDQMLVSFDGDVQLLGFDPMNLVCHEGVCLHTRFGQVRIGERAYLLESPFVARYGKHICDVKKILIPKGVADHVIND
jgi:hypothetical protein